MSAFPGLTVTVINLARRPDRLAGFLSRWRYAAPSLAVTVHQAADRPGQIDGQQWPPGHADCEQRCWTRPADVACLASHLGVLDTYSGPLLVLEDDACFAEDFTLDLHPPPDWDVLWLGGQHLAAPTPVDRTWVRPTYLVRTHAYLVRQPAALAAAARAGRIPRMDPYLSHLPGNQYALARHTVGQAAGRSDIGASRAADEFWQPRHDT